MHSYLWPFTVLYTAGSQYCYSFHVPIVLLHWHSHTTPTSTVFLHSSFSAPPHSFVTLSRKKEHLAQGAIHNSRLSWILPPPGNTARERRQKSNKKRFRGNKYLKFPDLTLLGKETGSGFLYINISLVVCVVSFILSLAGRLLSLRHDKTTKRFFCQLCSIFVWGPEDGYREPNTPASLWCPH